MTKSCTEYYATSQLAIIDVSGRVRNIGAPAIFDNAVFSPDGKYVFTSRIRKPYSYLFSGSRFPKIVEIWDANGKLVQKLPEAPLQDSLPAQGVPTGPRGYGWIPTESATLLWAEALDGGDPRKKVTPRDKLMTLAAPIQRIAGRAF
jgi:hypothetical protein